MCGSVRILANIIPWVMVGPKVTIVTDLWSSADALVGSYFSCLSQNPFSHWLGLPALPWILDTLPCLGNFKKTNSYDVLWLSTNVTFFNSFVSVTQCINFSSYAQFFQAFLTNLKNFKTNYKVIEIFLYILEFCLQKELFT